LHHKNCAETCHDGDCHDGDCGENKCHEEETCQEQNCSIDNHHNHHHHNHTSNAHDPHGISTVVFTMKAPEGPTCRINSDGKSCSAWGLDVNKLNTHLDEYLFGYMQEEAAKDWAEERLDFRKRFHGEGENPDVIVQDLLEKQKEKKLKQRLEQIVQNDGDKNDEQSNVDDKSDDLLILEVPQMDSIKKEVIYRMKGVFSIANRIPKWYLQSVFNTFDFLPSEALQTDEHSSIHDEIYSNFDLYNNNNILNNNTNNSNVNQLDLWGKNEQRYCSMIVIGVNINIEKIIQIFLNSQID